MTKAKKILFGVVPAIIAIASFVIAAGANNTPG
mgnify:CR=1 FL=1